MIWSSLAGLLGRGAPHAARLTDGRHAGALSRLHAAAFARPWGPEEFERMLAERDHLGHALMTGGTPRGFVLSRRVLDEAEILSVLVAPALRGRGHAGALIGVHLSTLAGLGLRDVHLEVEDGNLPAIALYRRYGFAQTGRREGYYARLDGTRGAALSMRATLT